MQLSLPFDDVEPASEADAPPLNPSVAVRKPPATPLLCEAVALEPPLAALPSDEPDEPLDAGMETQEQSSESERLPANLAELELLLRQAMPATRKTADMRSALRTTAKVLGRRLEDVTADAAVLNTLLAQALPAGAGVSPGRWSRVKSLLVSALATAGFDVLPSRDLQGYSPVWQALAEQLPDKRTRIGLSRMLSYFSREGIAPKELTVAHIEEFGEALKTKSLRKKPLAAYRECVRIWNRVAAQVEDWPPVVVTLEPDRRLYALPWEDFPTAFRADVADFQANSSNPDPFSPNYSPPVRPETQNQRRKQIHQVASALVASGFPIDELTSLKVLVQPKHAEQALRHLLARRGGQTGEHLESQARLLRTIARHWVGDAVAADKLARMSQGLHVKKSGMTPKNRQRLRQFDVPENVEALLNLPLRIFAEAGRHKRPSRKQALRVMRALAVELLIVAPMRVCNVTQIEIGRHLLEFRRGKHRRCHIVFAPEETKTREPFEMELPQQTVVLLEIYLERFRPVLSEAASPFLFPNPEGGKRCSVALSQALQSFVKAEAGLTMHAHLFRQFAGKFYLDKHPDDIETIRRILGHRTTATTLRAYAQLRTDHAFRRYDGLVEAHRAANVSSASHRKSRRPGAAHTRHAEANHGPHA